MVAPQELGLDPAEAVSKLKAGESLEGAGGQRLAPEQVLMVRPGRKCVLLGDTCNSSAILSAPSPLSHTGQGPEIRPTHPHRVASHDENSYACVGRGFTFSVDAF